MHNGEIQAKQGKGTQLTHRDAKVWASELRSIEKRLGYHPGATEILESATDKRSPLHHFYEWNDAAAAHAYRLAQTRTYVSQVMITYHDGPPQRMFQSVPVVFTEGQKPRGCYVETVVALADPTMREQVLEQAYKDYCAFRDKWRSLRELAEIFEAGDKAFQQLQRAMKAAA